MTPVIYFLAFCFTVLSIIKHTHTNWLLKNSTYLRYKLENAETEEEKHSAYMELLEFTNKHLKSLTIYSIFVLVLDYLHNRHPK